MITKGKIDIYQKYQGDSDRFARMGSVNEKSILNSEAFYLIHSVFHDIELINKKLCDQNYKDNFYKNLNANFDAHGIEAVNAYINTTNYTELIEKFYTAFSNGNHKGMADCYHEDIIFEDPAFGKLKGIQAVKMWEMLLSRSSETPKISFNSIEANSNKGTAKWKAEYVYGKKKRKVVNEIQANFKFKEGKIIEHKDAFNVWKWTQQALGPIGYVLGWTSFMKNKIQKTTNKQLAKYMNKE